MALSKVRTQVQHKASQRFHEGRSGRLIGHGEAMKKSMKHVRHESKVYFEISSRATHSNWVCECAVVAWIDRRHGMPRQALRSNVQEVVLATASPLGRHAKTTTTCSM